VGGREAPLRSAARRSSSGHRSTRRGKPRLSSLECVLQLDEAARDPAGDRPGGELERVADRLVALVAREEAVEDLAAVPAEPAEGVADVEGLVQALELFVGLGGLRLLVDRDLAARAAQRVDAEPPCQLGEPGPD